MDHTPDDKPDARKLTVTAADLMADITPERRAMVESSYRRGVHQAFAFAADVAERGSDVKQIRRDLGRAETLAGELRFTRKSQGNGMLLDHIRQALHSRKGPK